MSRRTDRVEDLLRAELSELILRRVNDPRVRLATVNSIEVSPDLRRARVLLSVLGSDEDRRACLDGLRHARGFLRSQLARNLRHMKAIPELHFELDTGAEYSQHISSILDSLEFHDESS